MKVIIDSHASTVTMKVFNIAGQPVYSEILDINNNILEKELNLANYQKGVYFVKVMSEEGIVTKKVTVY
jgi:hypothetical protein